MNQPDKGSYLVNILYQNNIINEKILGLDSNEKDDLINIHLEPNKKDFTYCDLYYDKDDFYYESGYAN